MVTELSSTLKTDVWDGASGLLSIYQYAMEAMIGANIYRDVNRTKECIVLLEPLRQGWHDAASQLPVQGAATGTARMNGTLGVG
ncbi:flagellar protein FliS [Arthrobacter sp. NA-172]|uniref:flagellar protein FliS n=1 Tax=Arthrobacter sp. NA-172 TaxID=3367524 RepID=UPI0037544E09